MHIYKRIILFGLFISASLSCNKLVEAPLDPSKIEREQIFSTDYGALSAIAGVYYQLNEMSKFSGGGMQSVMMLGAWSADELVPYGGDGTSGDFYSNNLRSDNFSAMSLWMGLYKVLYEANAVIEGVAASGGVSATVRNQATGEALFLRAFCHFYLVNLFGPVPLALHTDYHQNALLSRTSPQVVYEQILTDLTTARDLLGNDYPGPERIRVNKATAEAFLARVHLYLGNWALAETFSTAIIDDTRYALSTSLNDVFVSTSTEAIWQIRPVVINGTWEAYYLVLTQSPTSGFEAINGLSEDLLNAFEPLDQRKTNWIGSYTEASTTWYYPFKYKVYQPADAATEYSVVFRASEQYLIRAEARARQGMVEAARADLDSIRVRAGLAPTTATDEATMLAAIKQERRVELFTEWGHRWLDLKRWKDADAVLAPLKGAAWSAQVDTLYPVPLAEYQQNPNLRPQNPGY